MVQENFTDKDTLQKETTGRLKILFIINPDAGNHSTDWLKEITAYFKCQHHSIEFYFLNAGFSKQSAKNRIALFKPDKVVAVGGDGTVSFVAECLLQNNIPLGVLPAGSANGLAKELGISEILVEALHVIIAGAVKKIHVIQVNNRLCIHLSDIGFNAGMIKEFQLENMRGIWGYVKASIKAVRSFLFVNSMMQVTMVMDNEIIESKAAMIVIANATKYGTGAVINPSGNIEDELFEVVVIKKIACSEIFKMLVSHASFDHDKTDIFKTSHLTMHLKRKAYF